jgi:hypothetical protein
VRRVLKVAIWVFVFAACAGVGAFIAANSNPFPPGVDDPGARSGTDGDGDSGPPSSPVDASVAWLVRVDARTYHELFVGGRCTATWRIDLAVNEADPALSSVLDGTGVATRKGDLRCDEPNAQIQTERVDLVVAGRLVDGELRFRLDDTARTPAGAQDLAGFVKVVPTLRFRLPAQEGSTTTFDVSIPDGDRGSYGASGRAEVMTPAS